MQFRVLGPLEVEGAPPLGGPKQRALLALLLLARAEVVPDGRLVDELWGDEPPETARHALQVYVSSLRKALAETGAEIVRRGSGYVLTVSADDVDAAQFERLAREGTAALAEGDAATARAWLLEGLALWRGAALADLQDEPAARAAEGLAELRLRALEDLAEAELALGLHDELVPRLADALREHPFREPLVRALMLALYRSGRHTESLDAYRRLREQLDEEVGLEPGAELRELESAIIRRDRTLDVARPDVRVPAPLTSLVGRDAETASVLHLLEEGARLVTLTGPGGIGKTRLAIEAATEAAARYRDGVAFVALAELSEPELVAGEIARVLDADRSALAEHLAARDLLLVLDNAEHVVDGTVVLSELLAAAPRVAVLATSRVALGLYGEREHAVPPLAADDAVRLFVDRASARGVRTDADLAAVAEICERLDRLPLAIELAAARVREVSPQEMVPLLERRLDLASRGPRDVSPRQHALRGAIRWSVDLLEPSTAEAFAALAVFASSWTRESAGAIGVDAEDVLELEQQSLLVREDDRYRMLETIREFATELLDADERAHAIRAAHAELVREVVRAGEAAADYAAVEAELPNLRAALDWALRHDAELALELAVAPRLFWRVRGHFAEGRRWLDAALATGAGETPVRADALDTTATLAFRQGDYDEAERLWEESLVLRRAVADPVGLGRTLGELGVAAATRGDLAAARRLFTESVDLLREAQYPRLHVGLANLATVAADEGDDDAALAGYREALDAARAVGDAEGVAAALSNIGSCALRLGRRDSADAAYREGLRASHELGYLDNAGYCVLGLARIALEDGDPALAASLGGAGESLFEQIGGGMQRGVAAGLAETLERAGRALGAEAAEAARAAGAALALDEAVALALGERAEQQDVGYT